MVENSVKVDILTGSDISVQRKGDSLVVLFPGGDGRFERAGVSLDDGASGLFFLDYRLCEKFYQQNLGSDCCTQMS